MEVLSSRILLRPVDPVASREFYGETLGLPIYREFGEGPSSGVVYFVGGGFLEVSGRATTPSGNNVELWFQVRDVDATYDDLRTQGVKVLRPPVTEPWGLREMWISDPDGIRIAVIEVPPDHPLRRR